MHLCIECAKRIREGLHGWDLVPMSGEVQDAVCGECKRKRHGQRYELRQRREREEAR